MSKSPFFVKSKHRPFDFATCDDCGLALDDGSCEYFWNPNPRAILKRICGTCYAKRVAKREVGYDANARNHCDAIREEVRASRVEVDDRPAHGSNKRAGAVEVAGTRPEIMTLCEVADMLRLSRRTIYRRLEDGSIPACRVGSRWRFSRKVLNELFCGGTGVA